MHNLMHFNMFETSIIRLYVNEVLYKCGGEGNENCVPLFANVIEGAWNYLLFSRMHEAFQYVRCCCVCMYTVCVYSVHISNSNKLKSNIENEHFRSVYILTIRINIDSCCARYLHTLSLGCNEFQCVRVREGEKK